MDTFGSRLKMLRKKKGYTQETMAQALNMSRSNYGGYEVDRVSPPSEVLNKIADILDTSTDFLLCKTDSSARADAEDRFIDQLELSDEAIMKNFNLTLDGRVLSPEQMKMAIAFLRTLNSQK